MPKPANLSKAEKTETPRAALSQALILRTALKIIDNDGLSGLTVRKLSAQLGVTAMAIYRHYKNKAEIERELVDLVVGDYDVIHHDEEHWMEWVYVTYAKMRQALCTHPGVMPLLDNASYQGSHALAVMDRVLQELKRAGLTPKQAAQLFHTLMAHMIGTVVLMNEETRRSIAAIAEARRQSSSAQKAPARKLSFEIIAANQYPHISELAPHLLLVAEDNEYRASVMQIIHAIASKEQPS